jgi:hypothetical protein
MSPPSLCHTCEYMREVKGRRAQTYLLCRNTAIPEKYPPQPVIKCGGYQSVSPTADNQPV